MNMQQQFTLKYMRNFIFLAVCLLMLAACTEGQQFDFFKPKGTNGQTATRASSPSRTGTFKSVTRDVEAPDIFQVTDKGLWDGRPSLGGIWIAHPDVTEPERVIIRNTENSKFVIGALFRKERQTPGPVLQVSSDAAAALDMLAGAPGLLNVTALRRETAEEPEAASTEDFQEPGAIQTAALDPVAGAAAAIEQAETAIANTPAQPANDTQQVTSTALPSPGNLDKPYLQIGIFGVPQNAENTAIAMRNEGMVPTLDSISMSGKSFTRVTVGPATSKSERAILLKKVKALGFDDAFAVKN